METRANYVLIGAFTIAGLLGILAFFLWFARLELDRQFAYYDIRFPTVSGLSNASDVRFSGLPVGQVVDVRLAPVRDGTILVRVEVAADTPVRTDSVATIESQGVTGVSFVGIGPGTPEAPLLMPTPDMPVPEIEAGRSMLQSLSEDAPKLLENALKVIEDISALLGDENQNRVNAILVNIEDASAEFAAALEDFSAVTGNVSDFAEQIGRFNETLESLSNDLTGVLATADTTIASIGELSEQGKGVLDETTKTLTGAQSAIARTETFIAEDLTLTANALRDTSADLRVQIETLSTSAREMMAAFELTGQTATARLQEAQDTIAAANSLIVRLDSVTMTVGDTVANVDALIRDEGRPLVAETRLMVAEATRAIAAVALIVDTDLPRVVSDIRTATATASKVIANVGGTLTSSSARVDELIATGQIMLEDATIAFTNANVTLEAIDDAMDTADRAMLVAESAFASADRIMEEEVSDIVAGLKATLSDLQVAIGRVSDDIPGITADLREASQSATAAFADIRRVTSASAPAVQEFTTTVLPLFARLAQETRTLIGNLDRLTTQIQRDPARFLLNRDTPEFRR
ncbi:MAG: MCE family protein [Rhodobacteraceae bacterium]|nr:MAG: MCE family protein [Paracoccaceae bacterium]